MTRQTLNAPKLPTQAEIDAAVARGRRLHSAAIGDVMNTVSALFVSAKASSTDLAVGNRAR